MKIFNTYPNNIESVHPREENLSDYLVETKNDESNEGSQEEHDEYSNDHYDEMKRKKEIDNYINRDIKQKFDDLNGIEESMRRLNDILDYSSKSTMKFKFEQGQNSERNDYLNENRNEYINNQMNTNEQNRGNDKKYSYENESSETLNSLNKKNNMNYINILSNGISTEPVNSIPRFPYKSNPSSSSQDKISTNYLNNQNGYSGYSYNPSHKENNKKSISIPINRNVVDMDNGQKYFSSNKEKSNSEYIEKQEDPNLNDLDYMKDLLMKTKRDLDDLNKKFESIPKLNSSIYIDNEELEPRKLPNFYSNKYS